MLSSLLTGDFAQTGCEIFKNFVCVMTYNDHISEVLKSGGNC